MVVLVLCVFHLLPPATRRGPSQLVAVWDIRTPRAMTSAERGQREPLFAELPQFGSDRGPLANKGIRKDSEPQNPSYRSSATPVRGGHHGAM